MTLRFHLDTPETFLRSWSRLAGIVTLETCGSPIVWNWREVEKVLQCGFYSVIISVSGFWVLQRIVDLSMGFHWSSSPSTNRETVSKGSPIIRYL